MTPEQIAEKHFPFNTTCPAKKKKILWQREQLIKDINAYFSLRIEYVQGNYIEKK